MLQYIILDDKKRPAHKFMNGEGTKTYEEVKDFDNYGVLVPKPFIILDFDTKSDAEIMLNIIETLDLKCRVMKTTRGIHVWFKSVEPWKCFKKTRLACGIYSDCKSHSKNAYVKIKDKGVKRKWIKKTPFKDIQEVPKWLYPISNPAKQFEFKGMREGDGRNQELFNYIVYLQAKGFKKEEIKETINIINNFVFAESLDDFEISTICRDEAFKDEEEIEQQIKEKQRRTSFNHNEFGDDLINAYKIICVNNQLYVYENGYYQQDERIIERKMIDLFPAIKQNQRNEVLSYIRIKTHTLQENIKRNPYVINVENTRIDLKSGDLLPFTPAAIEFDRIPVVYDPSAYCADLDKMLNKVFLGDKEVINLFAEMIGSCLLKHNRYQKAFMLYGSGSNGKSTILNLIKKFLGINNYASIELDKLADRFAPAELENKLANIGDDINNIPLKETGTLKKLFSGDGVQVERKGERPFTLVPYATHIYSANEIPRSFDKTAGFYRRWLFIPFNAKFSKTDEDYDPLIEDKITTPNALSYLLNIAIKGAQRLIRNGSFTEPQIVKTALDEYKTDNSTTLTWIEDAGISEDELLSTPTNELYSNFCDWCKLSGIKSGMITGKKTFYKEIVNQYDFEDKPKQKSDGKRYFITNLD